MGQKVNPHGLRVGVIKDWDSKWFAGKRDFGDQLVEDYNIRKFVKKACYDAGVAKIGIERKQNRVYITIYAAKPGLIIGRGGSEIEKLKAQVEKLVGKTVNLNIMEVKSPDTTAQLAAENIAAQLERRISFRRAMKQVMGNAMHRGVKGIKATVSGRLGGAEIARSESYHEGTIPLQTLRADIDYGFAEAKTTYGILGVKVWIYKGEILNVAEGRKKEAEAQNAPSENRRDRRDRRPRGDRRGGNDNRRSNGGNRKPKGGNE
ncbi:MAG: 30S ribosomal protein S3 [Firmicutes bacterium]|nr:30S ribosomal protein S3 [Bacillota bacterium]